MKISENILKKFRFRPVTRLNAIRLDLINVIKELKSLNTDNKLSDSIEILKTIDLRIEKTVTQLEEGEEVKVWYKLISIISQ